MDENYEIRPVEQLEDPVWQAIGGNLQKYNNQQAGEHHFQYLCFALYATDQEIVGGLIGETYWGWLYINLLWIRDDLRGRGYGHRLLILAEEEGRRRGAKNVYLDTFSFQAPGFYQKNGYRVFGELPDFPTGHQRYFMTKEL